MAQTAIQEFFKGMWQAVLLRGIASLAFGLFCFFYPGITLSVLVFIFGLYLLIDGLAGLWGVFRKGSGSKGSVSLYQAILGVVIGVVCVAAPGYFVAYAVILIGLWNIAAGLAQAAGAVALRREMDNALLLGLAGLVSAVLGLVIIFYPAGAAVGIIWIIAGTAVLVGVILIAFAIRLRSAASGLQRGQAA